MITRRNILIFHSGALGDFILTWPLALALARLHPQSRLIYITAGEKGKLAERVIRVESMDVESGWGRLFAAGGQLPELCLRRLQGAQKIVNFVAGDADAWTRQVREIAPHAELLTLSPRPPAVWSSHATEYLLQQLEDHPVIAMGLRQMLSSVRSRTQQRSAGGSSTAGGGGGGMATNGDAVRAAASGSASIVIHPGAGSPGKCWQLERFIDLGDRFTAENRAVRFILGEVERQTWAPDRIAKLQQTFPVAKPANYLQLLSEVRSADLFIGNDSGPGHLAAFCGVPTLSLFGPTDPAVWQPLGASTAVLRGEDMSKITVDAVYAAAVRQMALTPDVPPAAALQESDD